jgi:hypothetical protein
MELHLTWNDLLKLGANGKVEKDGTTVIIDRPALPSIENGAVHFTLDESDPRAAVEK